MQAATFNLEPGDATETRTIVTICDPQGIEAIGDALDAADRRGNAQAELRDVHGNPVIYKFIRVSDD